MKSPATAEDKIFNQVDLLTWTVGASGSLGKFQFAVGCNHQSGSAEDVTLRNLLDGRVVKSAMDVTMGGFIYSLGYKF